MSKLSPTRVLGVLAVAGLALTISACKGRDNNTAASDASAMSSDASATATTDTTGMAASDTMSVPASDSAMASSDAMSSTSPSQ